MLEAYGSTNSRYFVVTNGWNMTLFRAPALLWTKNIPGLVEVMYVSHRGDVFFRTEDGMFKMNTQRDSEPQPMEWGEAIKNMRPGARTGRAMFSGEGTDMIIEIITQERTFAGKLMRLFTRKERKAYGYELMLFNNTGSELRAYPKKVLEAKNYNRFLWAISPSFSYVVMAVCSENGGGRFEVFRLGQGSRWADYTIKQLDISRVMVDDYGRVAMDIKNTEGARCLAIRESNGETTTVPVPLECKIMHFWKKKLSWLTDEALVIADFNGKISCSASLKPLKTLDINYRFFFNKNNEIDLVSFTENELFLTRIDPDQLHIDAKRWEYVAELKRDSEIERRERAKQEAKEKENKMREHEKLSEELAASLIKQANLSADALTKKPADSQVHQAVGAPRPENTRVIADIIADIKSNRVRFFAGAIERDSYLERLEALNEELKAADAAANGE